MYVENVKCKCSTSEEIYAPLWSTLALRANRHSKGEGLASSTNLLTPPLLTLTHSPHSWSHHSNSVTLITHPRPHSADHQITITIPSYNLTALITDLSAAKLGRRPIFIDKLNLDQNS